MSLNKLADEVAHKAVGDERTGGILLGQLLLKIKVVSENSISYARGIKEDKLIDLSNVAEQLWDYLQMGKKDMRSKYRHGACYQCRKNQKRLV